MTWSRAVREFLGHSILARVGFAAAVIFVIGGPVCALDCFLPIPAAQNLPRGSHLHLGRTGWTDELGRDILSRTLYGARIRCSFPSAWFAVVGLSA